MGVVRFIVAAGVAAGATVGTRRVLDALADDGERWTRTNHRGEPISLLEGPAVAAGLLAGTLAAGGPAPGATVLGTASAAVFGVIDDLAEDTTVRTKGLRGHLGALAQGRVTTGALKILGIPATALVAAAVGTERRGGALGHLVDVGVNGALIAGTANLLNLFDLRPGRALKAGVVASLPLVLGPTGAGTGAVLGAAVAAAPGDLGERDMLGDGGANALGALVGSQIAFGAPRAVRLAALAAVVGLTLTSERVSFSKVIAETPWLSKVDLWGRRQAPPAPAPKS
ncbi:hypothetical protein [Antribacter gilvus]|uniref:hypothetical protein n=1 Tax=Antribacter gilvus TaxID=2304675 RepID=UPI000F7846DD|nr:hypothetical protein [Antribacter gilvus]